METDRSLQCPIGTADEQQYANLPFNERLRDELLTEIKFLPSALEYSLLNLDEAQLHKPYRQGGWTISQFAHHIADRHINAFMRCKRVLTEEVPVVNPYHQDAMAQLADYKLPVNVSTTLLHALHLRWHALLAPLQPADWERTFYDAGQQKNISLWSVLKYYAWHGKHHVTQILKIRENNNW